MPTRRLGLGIFKWHSTKARFCCSMSNCDCLGAKRIAPKSCDCTLYTSRLAFGSGVCIQQKNKEVPPARWISQAAITECRQRWRDNIAPEDTTIVRNDKRNVNAYKYTWPCSDCPFRRQKCFIIDVVIPEHPADTALSSLQTWGVSSENKAVPPTQLFMLARTWIMMTASATRVAMVCHTPFTPSTLRKTIVFMRMVSPLQLNVTVST